MELLVLGLGHDPRTSQNQPAPEPLHLDPNSSLRLSHMPPSNEDAKDAAGVIQLLGLLS
jgi:hypothetical protein